MKLRNYVDKENDIGKNSQHLLVSENTAQITHYLSWSPMQVENEDVELETRDSHLLWFYYFYFEWKKWSPVL